MICASAPDSATPLQQSRLRLAVKVLIVWMTLGLIFLIFNIIYWPIYLQQTLSHPESFMEYAAQLPSEEARAVLREGIAQFNPPHEKPYEMLAALENQDENTEGEAFAVSFLESRARFYTLLQQTPSDLSGLASLACDVAASRFPTVLPLDMSPEVLLPIWSSYETALGLSIHGTPFSSLLKCPRADFALYALSGSLFSFDGEIGTTGVKTPTLLVVYSGGGSDERRGAHIIVDDTDHASKQRGMHVVLLHEANGSVLRADLFDLWEDTFEAERMIHFLNNAPDGCIGLFAVCDDGAAFMTGKAEESLMQFGIGRRAYVGRNPKILGVRYSFAAIGVKGAPPDSAMQCWSPEWFRGRRGHPVICAVSPAGDTP